MKWAPLALMLCCTVGKPPDCITKCGLEIFDAKWNCEAYQLAETKAMAAFAETADARLTDCTPLKSWTARVQPTVDFDTLTHGLVHGITHCNLGYIEIGSDLPIKSSLAHEMVHVLQECNTLPPIDSSDPEHSNWTRDGIYAALESVKFAK